LSVPLQAQREAIGVVQVVDEQPNRFDANALRLIELLANAAVIGIENARLFEETRQRADRLAAIGEISTAINLPLDVALIMQTAVDGLTRVLSVEQIGLALFDETHRHLTVVAESVAPGGSSAMGVQLPIVDNLSMDRILATKAPLSIVDAQNDPLLANVRDVMIQRHVQSILLVPLIVRDEIIGTLGCDAVARPHHFMPDEIDLVQTVANLLAVRLEQARLFEAERQHRVLAEALRDTAAALNSTLDFDEVLDLILANVERVTRHDAADVILLDSVRDRAQLARHRSKIDADHAAEVATFQFTPSQTRNLRDMLATGEPVIVADTRTYDGWIKTSLTEWIRSNLGVPIKIKGDTIGFLSLDSAAPNAFTEADADRLRVFADQAATAIYNARLYEQVQHHAADLEAKVAERTRELQRERNRLQAVFDSAGEGIQIVDLNYMIQYCNPATTRITGYASDEIVGRSIEMWRTGSAAPTVVDELRRRVQRGEPWQGELISRRKDGTPYDVAVTLNPLTDADGQLFGYVSVQRDITRLKELDRLKDQFVSRIGHELRTPLSNLIIYLNLLEHGKADKHGEYLQTLHREADRLRRLIEGFLKIADLDTNTVPIDLAPTDLNQLAMDLVAKQWPSAAECGLVLEPLLDPALPSIHTDAELVNEVLICLLDNAFNYTPRGGHVNLSTAQCQQADQRWITVTVRDTGPGLQPEELTRVFDRFYRGSATRNYTIPGVGLSLAICAEIANKLGGRITLESEPGQGAAFTMWLKP
jgi:PAS domain S-box-containing protein